MGRRGDRRVRAAAVNRAILIDIRERGYAHVRDVDGGISEWARRGWPMVAPPR
jgi:rhodanese-related sulfurtransferase